MGLRLWGITLLVAGILVIGTGVFAALSAREMWLDSDARCVASPNAWCGAGESLAAAFLFLLGPLGFVAGLLLMLAGGILLAIRRWLDRAVAKGLSALVAALD